MKEIKRNGEWPLFRMIIPAFREINIFTPIAERITALGPIIIATVADKLWGWRAEVIDENNYHKGPRDNEGLPDHKTLQGENPAAVIGLFCGLSSTMERAWQIADFYRNEGVAVIAGGWHAHYSPEESLRKGIDVVVHGDGEEIIQRLLQALWQKLPLSEIPGISYWQDAQIKTNLPEKMEVSDLNDLPFPNFGLLRFAKVKIYPIGRIRGCGKHCEFCSVRGKPHWATSQYLFEEVKWLAETRRAGTFFIVDDRMEEDRAGALEFFEKISQKYGFGLDFTVQIRLEAATDSILLTAMKKAGVRTVCIGYESPINEELIAMRKGYLSSDMVKWTKIFHSYGFFVHGMFIFGYPLKGIAVTISARERFRQFKKFIRRCRLDTVQILRPVPLVGTDLRIRLEQEGRLFPLDVVPWGKYDGSYACYQPNNMTLKELQELPLKLMGWHYNPLSFVRIPLKTLAFPFDYLIRGWQRWYRGWRNDIFRYGGHLLIKQWLKRYEHQAFLKKLEKFQTSRMSK
ncbi:MAG: cobalamin-dependent protein [bacterium]|nr:cobalamin-dependent protein [bacterium]